MRAARIALLPASWLYGFVWQAYLKMYQLGILISKSPHARIVVVGNLTVGGSGKSPVTRIVAETLLKAGKPLVLSCSGYGSPHSAKAEVAPEGNLDPSIWGDEPAMFRMFLPDVPIVVGRDRVAAARLVSSCFPNAVMLMDDGFQHLPLKKQLTLLVQASDEGNRQCLPAGPYREPSENWRRADLRFGDTFKIIYEPLTFWRDETQVHPSHGHVLCGIGQPRRFLKNLEDCGVTVGEVKVLSDHDPMLDGRLLEGWPTDVPTFVTVKDWVKLRRRPDAQKVDFIVARQTLRIKPEAEFASWLISKVDRWIT